MRPIDRPSRRVFLHTAVAATAALATSAPAETLWGRNLPAAPQPIRLGAPVFDPPTDPEQLALAHRNLGMRAAYCPAVELTDTPRITDIGRAFAKHDVVIAEVGRWKNLLDADPAQRQQNMQYVIDGLALADEVGALCCVDIAGSFSPESWYRPSSPEPVRRLLRCGGRERAEDHRCGEAQTGQVQLRDDGVGTARQCGQLPADDQGH